MHNSYREYWLKYSKKIFCQGVFQSNNYQRSTACVRAWLVKNELAMNVYHNYNYMNIIKSM